LNDRNYTVGGSGGTGTGTGTGTGGIQTGPVLTGPDAIFDFFCLELSHQPCHTDLETICGSDGNTYIKQCAFEYSHLKITLILFIE
jgi:hypothetical protein